MLAKFMGSKRLGCTQANRSYNPGYRAHNPTYTWKACLSNLIWILHLHQATVICTTLFEGILQLQPHYVGAQRVRERQIPKP